MTKKPWEEFIVFLCDYWWTLILLITLIITSILFFKNRNKAMPISNTNFQGGCEYISSTPSPQIPVLTREEAGTFIPVASHFSDPINRPVPEQEVSIQTILKNPASFNGYHVELRGKILKIQSLSAIDLKGWKDGCVFTFDDGSASIPVLYRGSLYKLENGVKANVSGVFVADGRGIHADLVYADIQSTPWYKTLPDNFFTFGIVVITLAIIALVLLLIPGKKQNLLLLVVMIFFLSACEFQIEHIVKPDGSVSASVQIVESAENVDFLRKLPGLDRYISTWIAQNRELGLSVENWVEGEREHFYIQQDHPDIKTFLENEIDDEQEAERSWVYVRSYSMEDETCYRYMAQVSPEVFYDVPEGTDSMVSRGMESLIDEIDMQYGVTLPGRLIYTNSQSQTNNRALWKLNLKKANTIIAESCSYVAPVEQVDWRWVWVGLAGVGLVDISLWILVIRKYLIQRKNG